MRDCRRWTLVALCLSCLTLTAWAQSSTPASDGSPICFSDSEWQAFEADVSAEIQRTAEEAVATATTPLRAEIAGLAVERDGWRAQYEAAVEARKHAEDAAAQAKRVARGAIVAGVVGTALGLLAGLLLH